MSWQTQNCSFHERPPGWYIVQCWWEIFYLHFPGKKIVWKPTISSGRFLNEKIPCLLMGKFFTEKLRNSFKKFKNSRKLFANEWQLIDWAIIFQLPYPRVVRASFTLARTLPMQNLDIQCKQCWAPSNHNVEKHAPLERDSSHWFYRCAEIWGIWMAVNKEDASKNIFVPF